MKAFLRGRHGFLTAENQDIMKDSNWMPKHRRLPLLILWSAVQGLALMSAHAASSSADSNLTTVDTRAVLTGTLTGHVQGNGAPVANAQVQIKGTAFSASTDSSGAFTVNNVPAGSGYLVTVAAAGFASKQVPGVTVSAGTTDMGAITLAAVSGPCRLVALAPDVNPSITTVEVGGTAYRYYLALNSANQPQGGVAVSAQVLGGNAIPQAGDVSAYWPGQTAGLSDADGVVRVSIPASALGGPGAAQTVQLSVAGQVQQTFQAQVMPRQYDQTWTQKLWGGVSVGELLSAEGDISAESEVRHTVRNGTIVAESISRTLQEKLQASVGFDVGLSFSASFSPGTGVSGGGAASALGGAGVGTTLSTTYSFDPTTTNAAQNAMKLYVDLGNVLPGLPGPPQAFYKFVESSLESAFLGSNLRSVEGEAQLGNNAQSELRLGSVMTGFQQFDLGLDASASVEKDAIVGLAATFGGNNEIASIRGEMTSGSWNVSAQAQANLGGGDPADRLGGAYTLTSFGVAVKQILKRWTRQGEGSPYRSERLNEVAMTAGQQIPILPWQRYDPELLYRNYSRRFTEAVDLIDGTPLATYSWSVSSSQQQAAVNFDFELGLGVTFQGDLDQGAEAVIERGVFWQSRYWPTEAYPAIGSGLFPTESWFSLVEQWGANAAGPIEQAVQAVATTVENAANTVVHVAESGYHGVLNIASGAMAEGSQLYASVSSGVWSLSGGYHVVKIVRPLDGGPSPEVDYLPPEGASNYVYGIGGIYRFASSNAFNGSATLTISYSAADVAGLNPADLRIYQLPDGTNRWQLIGGVVDTVSNTVSAVITNLGTYALAPPLPTGDLQLIVSTNSLPADGMSQMTAVVTNLVLNTGDIATQQWLFTATADGVRVLNGDCDTNLPGIQVVSTNGALTLVLQAPMGGTVAHVTLASVAGDATGSLAINLVDNTPPTTPTNVTVVAGQSRIWVSWATNTEPDLACYRVYYRLGQTGPPWGGTANVEGTPSPVVVTGTNCLLRGLTVGTNYFVAASAVDSTGNESPLSVPISVTTAPAAPAAPTGVAVRYGSDGTNILSWALSEDDGYNDRDVVSYDVWQVVIPGTNCVKVGQAPAGIGLFIQTNMTVGATQYLSYAVSAVSTGGLSSGRALAAASQPPIIIQQPQSVVTNVGATASFNVAASGPGLLAFQWRKGGTNVVGATSASYTIKNAQMGDAGNYTALVTNLYGAATSQVATLTIVTRPGSLEVTITPPAAVSAGAKWQVDSNGVFQASGATVTNLSAGNHTVSFKPIAGWHTPTNQVVVIASGATNDANAVYLPVDITKPTVKITSPKSGINASTNQVTVVGTAGDNVAVAGVYWQINGGTWAPASSTNNWTNWTASVALSLGTSTVRAYAVDTSTNYSLLTNSITIKYEPLLTVRTNGVGTVSPNLNGQFVTAGSTNTLTALPGKGYFFTNWTDGAGVVLTNGPALRFIMPPSNYVLVANFVPSPFTHLAGNYGGLFYETNANASVTTTNAGYFTATVTTNGSFTAKMQRGAASSPLSGQFSLTGAWSTNSITGAPGLSASLELDMSGNNGLGGEIGGAGWMATLVAPLAANSNGSAAAGSYTFILAGNESSTNLPGGYGFGTLSLSKAGAVTWSGTLGDGTAISTESASVSKGGFWPLYAALYSGNGLVLGWLAFTNDVASTKDLAGWLYWTKPARAPGTTLYTNGFAFGPTNWVEVVGSTWTNKAPLLSWSNGVVELEGANLAKGITNAIGVSSKGAVTDLSHTNKLTMTITATTGLFSGSVTETNGTKQTIQFNGVLHQKQDAGWGLFMGTNQTGRVFVGQP